MNESNIDRLFQITAPRTEWTPPEMHGGVQLPAFSDQLWQLTAPAAPERPSSEPRLASSTSPRDDAGLGYDADDLAPRPSTVEENRTPTPAPNGGSKSTEEKLPVCDSNQTGTSETHKGASESDSHLDEDSDGEDTNAAETANQPSQSGAQAEADAVRDTSSNEEEAANAAEANAKDARVTALVEEASTNPKAVQTADVKAESAGDTMAAQPANQAIHPPKEIAELQVQKGEQLSESLALASGNGLDGDAAAAEMVAGGAEEPITDGEGTKIAQRKVKLPGGDKTSDSTDVSLRERSPEDVKLLKDAAESKSAHYEADANGRDASTEGRRSIHSNESAARPVAQNSAAAAANQVASAVVSGPVANIGDTKAGSSEDSRPPATRISGTIGDGLSTALARGQKGAEGGATGEANEPGWKGVDTARFVGRVTKAFHFAQERGGTLQLRLSPPELGSLRLELTVKDGAMIANLETETPAARRLLLDHLPALRDRLAEQNVRVERFDVDVRRDDQPGHGRHSDGSQQQDHERRRPQQTAPTGQRTRPGAGGDGNSTAAPAVVSATSGTGINLVI